MTSSDLLRKQACHEAGHLVVAGLLGFSAWARMDPPDAEWEGVHVLANAGGVAGAVALGCSHPLEGDSFDRSRVEERLGRKVPAHEWKAYVNQAAHLLSHPRAKALLVTATNLLLTNGTVSTTELVARGRAAAAAQEILARWRQQRVPVSRVVG